MTSTATEQLQKLAEAEVAERRAIREAEAAVEAAKAHGEQARDELVQAHADGADVKAAERGRDRAAKAAEDAAIRLDAVELRLTRATRERAGFASANADALLEEVEPEAQQAADRVVAAVRELLDADKAWHAASERIGQLVAAHPQGDPSRDTPSQHVFTDLVGDARRLHRQGLEDEMRSPMPNWEHREHTARSSLQSELVRLERKEAPTRADECRATKLRRKLGLGPRPKGPLMTPVSTPERAGVVDLTGVRDTDEAA